MSAKIALITGAYKGIGLETGRQLGKLGITVLLSARDQAKAEAAAATLTGEGIEARGVRIDVNEPADYTAVAEMIDRDYGVLDILINNAGVMLDKFQGANETSTTTADVLRKTMTTNFMAPVALTQTLLPLLRKSEAGRIVNVGSILGSLTMHSKPGGLGMMPFAYDLSKAALNVFTIHLADELKDTKIKVNTAHPGWVKTDMGTDAAPMDIVDGAKTEVWLATLPEDGPTGGFFHMQDALPW